MSGESESRPLLLGLEIGGTKLQLGLGRGDGRIVALERRMVQAEAGAEGIRERISETFASLLDRPEANGERPVAVGIGFGGPVDADRGVVLRSHQIFGWDNFDLAGWASWALGVDRVSIQNDADTAGLGEARFGAGVGLSPVFYVTIGTGIGGGLILDGRIYRGSGLGAAEIGHLWVDGPDGTLRKLEDVASGSGISAVGRLLMSRDATEGPLDRITGGDVSKVNPRFLARAAAEGDPIARATFEIATRAVGRALAHVVTLLAPRRIILGGGVSLIGEELWFRPIRSTLDSWAFPPFRGTFDVVQAQLGEEVVVQGALALAGMLVDEEAGR